MKGIGFYASPLGDLAITSHEDKITGVSFLTAERSGESPTPIIEQCISEVDEYFFRGRKFFNVELQFSGTDFQNKVWNQLLTIPYGRTISYLELAIRVGDINSIRAVGFANGQNPIAILVPCHRVIGKNGDLIGYAGGLDKKIWLLQHEGAFSEQLRLPL
ncbi:MAG: methylated-DNA--[protein]-cysteine S-methyltransferase [Cyclobacteriaceae bacterium]